MPDVQARGQVSGLISEPREINKSRRGMRRADAELVSIIVRYDFEARRWKHSAGIVLTAREAAVLAMLAYSPTDSEIAIAAACSISSVEKTIHNLKVRFRTGDPGHPGSRSKLVKIANDLFV